MKQAGVQKSGVFRTRQKKDRVKTIAHEQISPGNLKIGNQQALQSVESGRDSANDK